MNDLNSQLPLFVYGTLRPDESNYKRYLRGRALSQSPAWVRGELWLDPSEDYPYLCARKDRVSGYLLTLKPALFASTMASIDMLEDFSPKQPLTSLYVRQRIIAHGPRGDILAWTYLWNSKRRPGYRLEGGDFSSRKID